MTKHPPSPGYGETSEWRRNDETRIPNTNLGISASGFTTSVINTARLGR
jgi:hypothetical protein